MRTIFFSWGIFLAAFLCLWAYLRFRLRKIERRLEHERARRHGIETLVFEPRESRSGSVR